MIATSIHAASRLASQIRLLLRGVEIVDLKLNSYLALAMFDLVFEHFDEIICAVDVGRFGSGAALLRPMIDAYRRGVWLHLCVDPERASRIWNGEEGFDKVRSELQAEISRTPKLERLNLDKRLQVRLHGLTHSGREQLIFRVRQQDGKIGPDYPDSIVDGIIQAGARYATEAAIVSFTMLRASHLNDTIAELYNGHFGVNSSK